jgi:hypothetical protein
MAKKHFFCILTVAVALTTSGCASYVTGRYTSSVDNAVALRAWKGQKVSVGNFKDYTNNAIMSCNYKGNITTMDGESYTQFIRNALITELKLADTYSVSAPIKITGALNRVDNSTAVAMDWTFDMSIAASNGYRFGVKEKYKFNGSVVGTAASTCGGSASAFVPAVQNIIGKIISKLEGNI